MILCLPSLCPWGGRSCRPGRAGPGLSSGWGWTPRGPAPGQRCGRFLLCRHLSVRGGPGWALSSWSDGPQWVDAARTFIALWCCQEAGEMPGGCGGGPCREPRCLAPVPSRCGQRRLRPPSWACPAPGQALARAVLLGRSRGPRGQTPQPPAGGSGTPLQGLPGLLLPPAWAPTAPEYALRCEFYTFVEILTLPLLPLKHPPQAAQSLVSSFSVGPGSLGPSPCGPRGAP